MKLYQSSGTSPYVSISSTGNTTTNLNNSGGFVGYSQIVQPKVSYTIFDQKVEFDGYTDTTVAMMIALINTIGIKYYVELKKQLVQFPDAISQFLEKELMLYNRNNTIEEIIK